MDITTILGLLIGAGAVIVSFILEGGHLSSLVQGPALILIICGTFGATIVTTPFNQLKALPKLLNIVFTDRKLDFHQLIDLICDLAYKSRKNGLLSLENELHKIKDSFLKKALQLAIDGFETNKIREILEIEMSYIEERHRAGAMFFQKLGGFSPTFGIIGTVLGLIHALSSIENSANMASSIASAFIATLWGVALANIIYLPISDKLKAKHQNEALYLDIILEGVLSLATGENPRIIRLKLMSFLLPGIKGGDNR